MSTMTGREDGEVRETHLSAARALERRADRARRRDYAAEARDGGIRRATRRAYLRSRSLRQGRHFDDSGVWILEAEARTQALAAHVAAGGDPWDLDRPETFAEGVRARHEARHGRHRRAGVDSGTLETLVTGADRERHAHELEADASDTARARRRAAVPAEAEPPGFRVRRLMLTRTLLTAAPPRPACRQGRTRTVLRAA